MSVRETTTLKDGVAIIADGLYTYATTVEQVEQAGARPCFSGLKAERVSDAFDYDAGADQLVCREGQRSIGKVRVDNGDLYYFSTRDCQTCPRRGECLTRGEREGTVMPRRRVYLAGAVGEEKAPPGDARSARRPQRRPWRLEEASPVAPFFSGLFCWA